jgi:hypothetical protein
LTNSWKYSWHDSPVWSGNSWMGIFLSNQNCMHANWYFPLLIRHFQSLFCNYVKENKLDPLSERWPRDHLLLQIRWRRLNLNQFRIRHKIKDRSFWQSIQSPIVMTTFAKYLKHFASRLTSPGAFWSRQEDSPDPNQGYTSSIQSTICRHIQLARDQCIIPISITTLLIASIKIRFIADNPLGYR